MTRTLTSLTKEHGEYDVVATARRRQILDAAAACFRRAGFLGTSMKDISKTAGMCTSHIYHYFENKQAIVKAVIEQGHSLMEAHMDTLKVLGSAIAKRDSETGHHNYRVVLFTVRLAEAAGLSFAEIHSLLKGAFLHDVGKVAISDHILLKPGRLGQAEFEVMKTHVSHGVEIVRQSHWLADAVDVVQFHHEKYDGSGYLEGRRGENIPFSARLFAIVDVYDALLSERPYKNAFSLKDTLETMTMGRGIHFDPHLLDIFMTIAHDLHAEHTGMTEDLLAKKLKLVGDAYSGYRPNIYNDRTAYS